jgi:transposase
MMSREKVAELDREALIELILQQAQQIAALQAEIEVLRKKLEKGKKPPTNSGNSSQPPSRDQKGNLPEERKKRRHGPPMGHAKYERKFVVQPDHIVEVKPKICHVCLSDVSQEPAVLADVNQITEIPEARAEVIEVRQYQVECACCGREQVGQPPVGLEMERTFGARLEAVVVYYRQEQHMSYVRTQAALHNLHGVEISQGGIDRIMHRAGQKALQEVAPIERVLQESKVIHSDETSARVDGSTWWQWVFCSIDAVLHVIRFNRSADVIIDMMGEHEAEVWVSDCLSSQLKAPAKDRQLCLTHQIRNLQAVVEQFPRASWAHHLQVLFRFAIHLHHQRETLPAEIFSKKRERIEGLFDKLLMRTLEQPDARRLQRRYLKHRDAVFLFLYRTDVSPTNNISEQRLRPSVIHRKVTGGFRSDWGAQTYAALKSLIDTAALSDIPPFQVIQHLFGSPSLPLRV